MQQLQAVAFVFGSQVELVQSLPKLTVLSVINDIGSSLGLWLGISLYTIYELVTLAGRVVVGHRPGGWRAAALLLFIMVAPLPALLFAVTYLSPSS